MSLHKEIWIDHIQEGFYNDSSFLKSVTDMSHAVEYNRLHIASAGMDPKVLIDNNTYPIEMAERADLEHVIEMKRFETENTIVRSLEAIELAYDKQEDIIRQHRETLRNATAKCALHAYAPMRNTAHTPVLRTTGETTADGRKRLTFNDILDLKVAFDLAKYPAEGRYLVLNPHHVTDLLREDLKMFKDLTEIINGEPKKFAGFGVYTFGDTPTYMQQSAGLEKQSFETAEQSKLFSSVAFIKTEVMKADGECKMFATVNDPTQRGDIFGFEKRFVALPIRNKGIGAIVSEQV